MPIKRLCKKDGVYDWEYQQEEAFHTLKTVVVSTPVLIALIWLDYSISSK